jgi:hypothetical protein
MIKTPKLKFKCVSYTSQTKNEEDLCQPLFWNLHQSFRFKLFLHNGRELPFWNFV